MSRGSLPPWGLACWPLFPAVCYVSFYNAGDGANQNSHLCRRTLKDLHWECWREWGPVHRQGRVFIADTCNNNIKGEDFFRFALFLKIESILYEKQGIVGFYPKVWRGQSWQRQPMQGQKSHPGEGGLITGRLQQTRKEETIRWIGSGPISTNILGKAK